MDIVTLLQSAVQSVPNGDHTVGLNAIVRHVKAAIRHLERDKLEDPDTCTDAIYRTNQAYEGSLKEAYRVLAKKDPAGLSPYTIEQYLETHQVIRPRVLTQLTRYRQDYRNPSAHDYKLDFDDDEALLAIVSVCAFAELLTNQIDSRIASDAAQVLLKPSRHVARSTLKSQGQNIAKLCRDYTNASNSVQWFEYERGLAEVIQANGYDVMVNPDIENRHNNDILWDIEVSKGRSVIRIDTRVCRSEKFDKSLNKLDYFMSIISEQKCVGGILVLRLVESTEHSLFRFQLDGKDCFLLMDEDYEQLASLRKEVGELTPVE